MTRHAILWGAGGLVAALTGLVGFAHLTTSLSAPPRSSDWRPPCVVALGPPYDALDVDLGEPRETGRVVLLGIDRSPSNREQSNAQLETAVQFAAGLPVDDAVGLFFVSDLSDRSSTPDLPFEDARASRETLPAQLPCGDCPSSGLFEQQCLTQLEAALIERRDQKEVELTRDREAARSERARRIHAWHDEVATWWPRPGTSILRFWNKVADLPAVRRDPERVIVALFGDLEEARTPARRRVERFARAVRRAGGSCAPDNPLVRRLDGVEVFLLQTVVDSIDADRWGEAWNAVLKCAGATVTRYRYSPALGLDQYFATL